MRRVVDWVFRSRESGRLTFGQMPNALLWIYILAVVVRGVANLEGSASDVVTIIATCALFLWAGDEIVRGVNPFRRALGAFVILGMLT